MAFDEKCFNMKVVCLFESVDFDIKIILIRGRMQPMEAKQGQKQKLQSHFRRTELIDSVRPSWSEKLKEVTESWQRSLGGTEAN